MNAFRAAPRLPLSTTWARIAVFPACLLYAWALHYAHVAYLYPIWAYFGFTYRPLGWREIAIVVGLIAVGSVAVPLSIRTPSSIIVTCIYIAVYLPAVVFTMSIDTDRLERYVPILIALAGALVLASVVSRAMAASVRRAMPRHLPGPGFSYTVLGLWTICCITLVATYAPVMTLVSFEDVYDQRAAGASTGTFIGYTQTSFAIVLSPALIAIGLAKSRPLWALLGAGGCLVMFTIDAQRTVFLLPAAMLGLHLLLRSRFRLLRTNAFAVFAIAVVVILATTFNWKSTIANGFTRYLTFRTLAFPGLTYSLYYDLFSRDGFTYWSHVRGFNKVIPAPATYANDRYWPRLGYIVADRIHHMENNANANLFSGDGVAAAGAAGTLAVGAVFAIFLALLDHVSRGWSRHFTILLLLPVGITLINGHFFTTMLSFGGFFWLVMLYLFRPRRAEMHVAEESAAR